MKFWKRLVLTLEMIKFEHSVFALPFALTGALLGFRESHIPGRVFAGKLLWIVIAMVAARSAAMAFNRILDADIDARNPRTRARHIPAGLLSPPRRFGIRGALWIGRIFHVTMIGCLAALAFSFELGWLSLTGIGAVILLLLYEHSMVKADDLSRVNAAFFTVNGYVSVLFFLFWAADIYFLGMRA